MEQFQSSFNASQSPFDASLLSFYAPRRILTHFRHSSTPLHFPLPPSLSFFSAFQSSFNTSPLPFNTYHQYLKPFLHSLETLCSHLTPFYRLLSPVQRPLAPLHCPLAHLRRSLKPLNHPFTSAYASTVTLTCFKSFSSPIYSSLPPLLPFCSLTHSHCTSTSPFNAS